MADSSFLAALPCFSRQGRLSKRQKTRQRNNAAKRGRKLGRSPPTPLVRSLVRLYFFGGRTLCAWSVLQVCYLVGAPALQCSRIVWYGEENARPPLSTLPSPLVLVFAAQIPDYMLVVEIPRRISNKQNKRVRRRFTRAAEEREAKVKTD